MLTILEAIFVFDKSNESLYYCSADCTYSPVLSCGCWRQDAIFHDDLFHSPRSRHGHTSWVCAKIVRARAHSVGITVLSCARCFTLSKLILNSKQTTKSRCSVEIGLRQSLVNVDAHKHIPDIIYNDAKQNILFGRWIAKMCFIVWQHA